MRLPRSKKHITMVQKSFISLIAIVLLSVTIALTLSNGKKIYHEYQELIDSQINLNDFSQKLDSINSRLSLGYMYQRFDKMDGIQTEIDEARRKNVIFRYQRTFRASRSVVDYCSLVDTFLDQCEDLSALLEKTKNGETDVSDDSNTQILLNKFKEAQYTISYIDTNFKTVFSEEVMMIREKEAAIERQNLRSWCIIAVLFLIALCISFFYVQSISKTAGQLKKLTVFAGKIKENPYFQGNVAIESNDELALFSFVFNEMVKTIQNQLQEIQENSKVRDMLKNAQIEQLATNGALQNSRLQLLQSRINPHFLFNTLNMIKSTAAMEKAPNTYDLIEATADLLEYNLANLSVPVLLGDETENIKNYVLLQTRRFGERIAFSFDVDDDTLRIRIPAMILQPLVENSITHGLKDTVNGGRINISVRTVNGRLNILVKDNGCGFDSREKERILQECRNTGTSSRIGIRNVYQRLSFFFNGDVQPVLESTAQETTVGFSLPMQQEQTAV
ncbi:MAG: histidine kinase [Treponema sp.]|nr:histidine kinase [Treponema sp.]